MKRSEVIKLMVAFEEQAFKRFGYNLSRAEVMDGILLQLEKAGMLPPTYERGPNEVELQAGIEEDDRVFVAEWEAEDE